MAEMVATGAGDAEVYFSFWPLSLVCDTNDLGADLCENTS